MPRTIKTVGKNAFAGCSNLTIYTYFEDEPSGFDAEWNPDNCKVYLEEQWGQDDTNPERINLLTEEDFAKVC